MKSILHYDFVPSGAFTGTIQTVATGTEVTVLTGNKMQPGNALKLAAGTNAWSQESQQVTRSGVTIATMTEADWTNKRLLWVTALCQHIGNVPSTNALNELITYFDSLNLFQLLSGVSLAYVETDVTSGEISIGVNVYPLNIEPLMQSGSGEVRVWLATHYIAPVFISHLFNVTYLQRSEIVWCFGGTHHTYTTSIVYNLSTGGGVDFGEVKLAGNGKKASYTIKKGVNPLDPTGGLYSGTSNNLTMGEQLHLLDTSIHTTLRNGVWTWLGDYKQIPFVWYIAEITHQAQYNAVDLNQLFVPIEALNTQLSSDFELGDS